MKGKFTATILALSFFPTLIYTQSTEVVPSGYTTVDGTSSFAGPVSNLQRSYQMLMDSTILTNLMDKSITGMSFRTSALLATTWPASTTTFNNYDIYIGKAILIQSATNTFNTNQSGTQTQVRSGNLIVNANEYPAGGVDSWGPTIEFNDPYTYTGGNLSILIRHDTSNGTSRNSNALSTSTSGYNTLFKACWSSSYTGTGGSTGNFCVLRLTYASTLPVELISFTASTSGYNARLNWETASEKNMNSYVIESSYDGIQFEAIQTIPIKGESTGLKKYSYNDDDVFKRTQIVFYRLKMLESDGSYKYSNVNKLSMGKVHSSNLVVFPNPVKSMANISFTLAKDTELSCEIFDITGKLVYHDVFKSSKGNNAMLTDLSHLNKGYYILKLKGNGLEDLYKFIKD